MVGSPDIEIKPRNLNNGCMMRSIRSEVLRMKKSEMINEIDRLYQLKDFVVNEYMLAKEMRSEGRFPADKESEFKLLEHLSHIIAGD